ncbi:MAG: heavy-metal-associated domain-containing protein [Clostridia bacterium]|nr:heavy-metal-associated domain-containing protein [Clostridia bacterium]
MKQVVLIEGMHCGMCSARVTRVFEALSAVDKCEVDLDAKKAILDVTEPLNEAFVRETVENMGFDFISME